LPGLPAGRITDMCISSANPAHFYVTAGGFTGSSKVYESLNGGDSWENITLNLPNVPATCISYQDGTNDAVYVGTDLGVYYKNNDLEEWIDFSNGLPNVVLGEIEIQYGTSKLRAGTYGRGLWESPLMDPTILAVKTIESDDLIIYPNPASDLINICVNTQNTDNINVTIENLYGLTMKRLDLKINGHTLRNSYRVDDLQPGIYFIRFEGKDFHHIQRIIIK